MCSLRAYLMTLTFHANANRGYSLDKCPGYWPDYQAMGDCFNCGHSLLAHESIPAKDEREQENVP